MEKTRAKRQDVLFSVSQGQKTPLFERKMQQDKQESFVFVWCRPFPQLLDGRLLGQ